MTVLNLPNIAIDPIAEPTLHPYHLGASLYMPATRTDIWQVITRQKLPKLNSVIICMEDAVSERDIDTGLASLQQLLDEWANVASEYPRVQQRPLVFIRPRHPAMLRAMADWQSIGVVDGFVLPKVDMLSLADWRLACQALPSEKLLMPTLETAHIFTPNHNQELAMALREAFSQQIFALRIGGNDLLSCLRLRRPQHATLYESPIGQLIFQLLGCFVPYGFYLTAPVFEYLDKPELFAQELQKDVEIGLVGKTVIHPSQIDAVQRAFAVENTTLAQAQAILHDDAKAVFKQDNTMLEPATHKAWAKCIIERARLFGTV